LHTAITDEFKIKHFQPTNINFSLFPPPLGDDLPESKRKDKKERKTLQIQKARESITAWNNQNSIKTI